MLQVVRDHAFPLFIVERSPRLTRDLDVLIDINQRAWVGVVFSMSSVDLTLKRAFEPHSAGVKQRLQAMQTLAQADILVGPALMPILPRLGDDERHLEKVIQATRDHGGSLVMAGALTMDGAQAERTLEAARRCDSAIASGLFARQPGLPTSGQRVWPTSIARMARLACKSCPALARAWQPRSPAGFGMAQ